MDPRPSRGDPSAGAALMTRGPQLTIAQGTVLNASLEQAVSVRR
jgi:hypothetical protein